MNARNQIISLALGCLGQGGPEPWATEAGLTLWRGDRPEWCGLFVRAIWRRAGLTIPNWQIGSGNTSYLRRVQLASPGDLATFARFGHQAIVLVHNDQELITIDGNSTGGVVRQVSRSPGSAMAFYEAPIQ